MRVPLLLLGGSMAYQGIDLGPSILVTKVGIKQLVKIAVHKLSYNYKLN